MRPVPWPGARQLVSAILTAPHGRRSGPMPDSIRKILHSVDIPVLVAVTYQVITLVPPEQSLVSDCAGGPPFTEASFWQAMPAWRTVATAFVVAPTAAPLAWTPPH